MYATLDFIIDAIDKIFKRYGSDIKLIVHTAAQPSHDWAAKEPLTDFTINANGTINLLEATRSNCPEAVFIFTSTNKVYGDTPNLLPLLVTAGLMGYLGVPIKPSTILVFSIAFGISVDDTIHFLAKYRQELQANQWRIKKSVYAALRETGVSMFYTSIVLFFGFSVFTISSFGGTVALGALVSITLLFAMLSNLLLLPSLLLSLERIIANKEVLKKPAINIIPSEDDTEEDIENKD